jgi:hypothetical protein
MLSTALLNFYQDLTKQTIVSHCENNNDDNDDIDKIETNDTFSTSSTSKTSSIFTLNEKDSGWLVQDYRLNIPLYFNCLNSKDFEIYERCDYYFISIVYLYFFFFLHKRHIAALIKEKHKKNTISASIVTTIDEENISNVSINTITTTSNGMCLDEEKTTVTSEPNETNNTTTTTTTTKDIVESINTTINEEEKQLEIDFSSFKTSHLHKQMMIKVYTRFLYAFGIVITDFSIGKLQKIVENCYTFDKGIEIINQNPKDMITCFSIVILSLFKHGFERYALELFKFFCNQVDNKPTILLFDKEFVNSWINSSVVKLVSLLMFKNSIKNLNECQNSIGQNIVLDESICVESYFKKQKNRLLANDDEQTNNNQSEYCECGIKTNPITLVKYNKYRFLQKKTNETLNQPTARGQYLQFLSKKNEERQKQTLKSQRRLKNSSTENSQKQIMNPLRCIKKGIEKTKQQECFRSPLLIRACVFWRTRDTCCPHITIKKQK